MIASLPMLILPHPNYSLSPIKFFSQFLHFNYVWAILARCLKPTCQGPKHACPELDNSITGQIHTELAQIKRIMILDIEYVQFAKIVVRKTIIFHSCSWHLGHHLKTPSSSVASGTSKQSSHYVITWQDWHKNTCLQMLERYLRVQAGLWCNVEMAPL